MYHEGTGNARMDQEDLARFIEIRKAIDIYEAWV
jgi:hypothetical protein